eukprot:2582135-Prymnesium_polylepis.1
MPFACRCTCIRERQYPEARRLGSSTRDGPSPAAACCSVRRHAAHSKEALRLPRRRLARSGPAPSDRRSAPLRCRAAAYPRRELCLQWHVARVSSCRPYVRDAPPYWESRGRSFGRSFWFTGEEEEEEF